MLNNTTDTTNILHQQFGMAKIKPKKLRNQSIQPAVVPDRKVKVELIKLFLVIQRRFRMPGSRKKAVNPAGFEPMPYSHDRSPSSEIRGCHLIVILLVYKGPVVTVHLKLDDVNEQRCGCYDGDN